MLLLQSITTTYYPGTASEVRAIDGVTLEIGAAEFVAVIGSNGSGKSTLLNVIAGSVKIDAGRVEIDGADVSHRKAYQRADHIARVFQDPFRGTAPSMTVAENLRLARLRGLPKSLRIGLDRRERIDLAERVAELGMGIEKRLDTTVGRLSGGERQAITLLMATLRKPKILLLDEHTAALDPRFADHIMKITSSLINSNQLTALMVTHDLDQAVRYGTRLIMMAQGHIAMDMKGEEKENATTGDLLRRFATGPLRA